MGNFYTNFAILGTDEEKVVAFFKQKHRRAYIVPDSNWITIAYDRDCEEQDLEEIEQLGQDLSENLESVVLSSLNHDDDHLLLRLFVKGTCVGTYNSFIDAPKMSFKLAKHFHQWSALPSAFFILAAPWLLFQVWRHYLLAKSLGLPLWSVGAGYEYISKGAVPMGLDKEQIRKI
jgi:hypothetical protein